jgi:rubredoxin
MPNVIRHCPKCGHDDLRQQWDSVDQAMGSGAMSASWVCPSCSWPEPEIVEMDQPVTVPDDAQRS